MNTTCKHCGQPCTRTYCSSACHAKSRKTGETRQCRNCLEDFYARQVEIRKGGGFYCSMKCRKEHKTKHAKGYLRIGGGGKALGDYVHRIVAEAMIGRPLTKGEVVHHKDGDIHNNSPDNLVVCKTQAEHIRLEIESGQRTYPHEEAVRRGRLGGIARRLKKT